MRQTLEVTFELPDDLRDLLLAELSEYDFNAFEQGEDYLRAYGPGDEWTSDARANIRAWLERRGVSAERMSERWIRPRNWNEKWAREVEPLLVEPFYITPSWQPVPERFRGWTVIEVDPKMTFGTGHHESTRLVLRLLPRWLEEGDRVLDAGAGTGILSVAAVKLGADEVIAFDNHPAAREHALEVFERNGVRDCVEYRTGEIDLISEADFSGILANINRNVLIELMPDFASKIHSEGYIILSGLMESSRSRIEEAAAAHGLQILDEATENEWFAVVAGPAAPSLR